MFFSVYNEDFLSKGYVEKGSPLEELMGNNIRGHKKEAEVLSQAISASNQRTKALVQLMEGGAFFPQPKKKDICKKCLYRTWCRLEEWEGKKE